MTDPIVLDAPAKRPRWRLVLLAPLLVLILATWVLAVAEHYDPVIRNSGGVVVAHRDAFSADDSAVATTPIDPQPTYASPTIVVAPRFTVGGATVTAEVWLYQQTGGPTYTLMGISAVQTATGSTLRRAGASGNYVTNTPLLFDSMGADVYDVRYRSVSSGNVEPFAWSVGIQSRAAE